MTEKLILLIHCPDREGLVASVTSLIRRYHGNVVDLDQHVDSERHVFFMRVAWTPSPTDPRSIEHFEQAFAAEVATPYAMTLAARALEPPRTDGDLRLEGQPLPERPAVALGIRRVAGGHPAGRQQPPLTSSR